MKVDSELAALAMKPEIILMKERDLITLQAVDN